MTYLFDTNIVSELRRPARANSGLLKWVADVDPAQVSVSVLTLFELERGTRQAERKSPDLGDALRWWLDHVVMPNYLTAALPVSSAIALRAASFERQPTDDLADHLIAATALEHGLILVSRNVKHLSHPGVRLLNPFT